jgi:hypothetical protein
MNSMIPMILASTDVPADNPRLLGQVGAWKVFDSPYQEACNFFQPLAGEVTVTMQEEGMTGNVITVRGSVAGPGAMMTTRLFTHGRNVVALFAPEQTETAEVLDVAREVYGDGNLIPLEEGAW